MCRKRGSKIRKTTNLNTFWRGFTAFFPQNYVPSTGNHKKVVNAKKMLNFHDLCFFPFSAFFLQNPMAIIKKWSMNKGLLNLRYLWFFRILKMSENNRKVPHFGVWKYFWIKICTFEYAHRLEWTFEMPKMGHIQIFQKKCAIETLATGARYPQPVGIRKNASKIRKSTN